MSAPAAKRGDRVLALDIHIELVPSPAGPVPTPVPNIFDGKLLGALSGSVFVDNEETALRGSKALNSPPHTFAGGPFQKPPSNQGTIDTRSASVFVDNKGVARVGDKVITCNDPVDMPQGVILGGGTVFVGD